MHAAIIGIEGGMGQWLKHHLTGLGHTVSGYDERKDDNPSTLAEADLIIVSAPIPVTADIIRKTIKHMKQGACLVEIASLKTGIHEALLEAASQGFDVLCVHPMFGPSVDNLDGKTVAVIPVVDIALEKAVADRLFPGATLEVVDVCEHDRLMSIILSLPYLINMALAETISDENHGLLERLAGTSFMLQYTLTQSIVAEKTNLIQALLGNKFLHETQIQFIKNLQALNPESQSFGDQHRRLQKLLENDPEYKNAQQKRTKAYNVIKSHEIN